MRQKCFCCGKFIALGQGKITRIKRFDGKGDQDFCPRCIAEDEEYHTQQAGRPISFSQAWADIGTVEIV